SNFFSFAHPVFTPNVIFLSALLGAYQAVQTFTGNDGRGLSYTPYLLLKPAPHLWQHPPTNPSLFSCRFKCPCPIRRQWRFHGNADKAYNTLHFASKVVCQGASPFGNP
ncbi:hypothetical protein, partial [Flavonifractor plautii]|uniref:hypothetical protein n=1 Tax=Flavonifractor plautii TaxID=292800 RepID=UPI003B968524